MNEATIIVITELIGTIAFAISGAMIAIKRGLDLFGVVLVGCITAVGGGMLRDVVLGKIPPAIFSNCIVLVVAVATTIVVFVISYLNAQKFEAFDRQVERVNNIFDAIGLAAFSITGVEIACNSGFSDQAVFVISMGLLTGIGGGIIRDILVDKIPYVLKKHIYALASLLGSAFYYFIRVLGQKAIAIFVSMSIIIMIRIFATRYHWKLPKVHFNSKNFEETL